jgi:sugar lactone lactonase YvrE
VDVTAATQLTDALTHHGEGPLWEDRRGRLILVDMLAGNVVTLAADGTTDRHRVGRVAATVRLRASGGYVLGLERGFALTGPDFELEELLPDAFADPGIRMNDGACDPQGRFYCGTMAYDMRPGAGKLYRLDPDRTVSVVLSGVTVSNGLQWSQDGSLVYYSDTGTGRVDVFDVEPASGALVDRRPFAVVDPAIGAPDGLSLDNEGGVWVALWGGSRVHRYAPTGTLDDVVDLPVTNVTACTFGGDDRRKLFITTSRLDLREDEPAAGAVFVAEPEVAGLAIPAFAG